MRRDKTQLDQTKRELTEPDMTQPNETRRNETKHNVTKQDKIRNKRKEREGMKRALVSLVSVSPYGQSRFYQVEKKEKENAADYEIRTWRERMHYDQEGNVFIPPMQFKKSLEEAAQYSNIRIEGEGKATWTKNFQAGIMVVSPLVLPLKKDEVEGLWIPVPPDGKPGGRSRVIKCFPMIRQWKGEVEYLILDAKITEPIFRYFLEEAGKLIGIGFFRPRNRGYWGRYRVEDLIWEEES